MKRLVIWPWLLGAPVLGKAGKALTEGKHSTVPRRLAVTGLNCLSAMFCAAPLCEPGGEIDRLARRQLHERLLHIRTLAGAPLEALGLALLHQRVHRDDADAEQPLDRRLDLRLRRLDRNAEHKLPVLGKLRRL